MKRNFIDCLSNLSNWQKCEQHLHMVWLEGFQFEVLPSAHIKNDEHVVDKQQFAVSSIISHDLKPTHILTRWANKQALLLLGWNALMFLALPGTVALLLSFSDLAGLEFWYFSETESCVISFIVFNFQNIAWISDSLILLFLKNGVSTIWSCFQTITIITVCWRV